MESAAAYKVSAGGNVMSADAASRHEIDAAIRDFESKARSLQLHLKAGGYYQGKVDGDFGPISRQALADYKTRLNPK